LGREGEEYKKRGFAPLRRLLPTIMRLCLLFSLFGGGVGRKLRDKPQMMLGGLGGNRYLRGKGGGGDKTVE